MSGSSSTRSSISGAEPPSPRIPRLGWAIAFLVATAAIAWAYMQFRDVVGSRQVSPRLQRVAQVPDFRFTDQNGRVVTTADLRGKIWVADFIFTRCSGPCPAITARMAELDRDLGRKAPDVALVTFTVDPEHDTPAVLREYADRFGARGDRWIFLTGPKAKIEETVGKGFLQALGKDNEGLPIHSTRFVLVDRDGWIRGFQDGTDPEVVQKLLMDIGDLLRESPSKTR